MTTGGATTPEALARPSDLTVREYAVGAGVCVRPLLRRLVDRETGDSSVVRLRCGSTREAVCPTCAAAARRLRMMQCAQGWHREDEPDHRAADDEQDDLDAAGDGPADSADDGEPEQVEQPEERRQRSTRRRQDAPDLPRLPMDDRTVGRVFRAPSGQTYRPSMFVTLTLPSYGKVVPGRGVPVDPERYDYRRAALDALHFSKVIDRWVQNLRRCAGYKVQYFAAIEPQRRLAPHLHLALRGAIPRQVLKAVTRATYHQVWWPQHETVIHDRDGLGGGLPVWNPEHGGYCHPTTGRPLPTWRQALDQLDAHLEADPATRPAHVVRLGTQVDLKGIVAPSADADRAVRYLTKYLTKSISDAHRPAELDAAGNSDLVEDPAMRAHVHRLHAHLRWLPCSPRCANWLRYGVQPDQAAPGLTPGHCDAPAHDRDHLGVGGRRVLVSRQWSGKTLTQHRAERADVVRETLEAAGLTVEAADRCAATVTCDDGTPRFRWEPLDRDRDNAVDYAHAILAAAKQRHAWRAQYQAAKQAADQRASPPDGPVNNPFGNTNAGETAA